LPPAADASVVLPDATVTVPPAPLAPVPTARLTSPLWPADDAPLQISMDPLGPCALPDLTAIDPLASPDMVS
jgi:hypothetical protein